MRAVLTLLALPAAVFMLGEAIERKIPTKRVPMVVQCPPS